MSTIDAPSRHTTADNVQPTHAELVTRLFVVFGLILFSGALQRPVGGDTLQGSMVTGYVNQTNQMIQLIGAATYLLAGIGLINNLGRLRISLALYPILFLNLFAIISFSWSVNPTETLVRSMGLTGCTIFGLYVISAMSREDFIKCLVQFSAILIVATMILAIVAPDYAYHNAYEFYKEHAGLLKGTYTHKNTLAKVISLCVIIILAYGMKVFKSKYVYFGIILGGLWLLALTGSAKTVASVPAAVAIGMVFSALRTPNQKLSFVIFGAIAWIVVEGLGLTDLAFNFMLELLDRSPTLSGRTLIWEGALTGALQQNILIGGGYEAAWQGVVGQYVRAWAGFDPGHPHNGFINTFTELGLIGLLLLLIYIVILASALLTAKAENKKHVSFLIAWLVLYVSNNLGGTFAMLPADIYWLMLLLSVPILKWPNSSRPVDTNPSNSRHST